MTLKEFMALEGYKFKNFTWVNVTFEDINFSIGEDLILGSLSEEQIKWFFYDRTIKSIEMTDLEVIDNTMYFEYKIVLN